MAYTPRIFTRNAWDNDTQAWVLRTRTAETVHEDVQLLWDGWTPGSAAPTPPTFSDTQQAALESAYVACGPTAPDPGVIELWGDTSGATPVLRAWNGTTWEVVAGGGSTLQAIALTMLSAATNGPVPFIITQPAETTTTTSPEMAQFWHSGDKTFWLNEWGAPRVRIPVDKNGDSVFKGFWPSGYTGVPFQLARDGATTVYQFAVHADGSWSVAEASSPSSPPSGMHRFYPKVDGMLYSKDDAGVERQVTPAAPAQYLLFHPGTTAYVLSPLTAGVVEPGNQVSARILADLADAKQMRLSVGQRIVGAGATSCDARVQYATDGAAQTTWTDANSSGTGVSLQGGAANLIRNSGWVDLASGAKVDDCHLRLVTVTTGTLTTAPSWYKVQVEFR